MELVKGETLAARLRRAGPLAAPEALGIAAQVARALGAAEAQGVVHRDLKPSNLMLAEGPDLQVKVIDVGLAKAVASAGESILTYGGFVGTPAFASPEQFSGASVDARSDLYALGVTLWEMLAGQAPFRGSRTEVMRQHLHAPLPLDQLKGVPQPVMALVQTLLQKDPARRFQSAAELLRALPAITAAIDPQRTLIRNRLHQALATNAGALTRKKSPVRPGPKKISVARLPVTGKELFGREEDLGGAPNCTGCAESFWRPWVVRRRKSRLRFVKPSESPRSRSRFRWRNARRQPTQSTRRLKASGSGGRGIRPPL
jgi:serine/threonine protein kinase